MRRIDSLKLLVWSLKERICLGLFSGATDEVVRRLESLGLLVWLLKDLGWVLLIPHLAAPAAAIAVALDLGCLVTRWASASQSLRVHAVAVSLWLCGNVAWMFSEFLFEPTTEVGRKLPWYEGPYLSRWRAYHNTVLMLAQAAFLAGLLLLLNCYGRRLLSRRVATASDDQAHMPLELSGGGVRASDENATKVFLGVFTPMSYRLAFIGPWIMKDLLWSVELLKPALPCALIAALIMADNLRRWRESIFVTEFMWLAGNTAWLVAELVFFDTLRWPRQLAALCLVFGVVAAVGGVLEDCCGFQCCSGRLLSASFAMAPVPIAACKARSGYGAT